MPRELKESGLWHSSIERIGIAPGTPRANRLADTIAALIAAAEDLPKPQDYETRLEPIYTCWCRRVATQNLWVLYRLTEDELIFVMVHGSPPVPRSNIADE